jgi:UDP-N-acetylmuramoyl-tripeptide--D-alanyl-D-alanine ligase
MLETLNLVSHFLLTITLGYYLIVNLQWYNYQIQRVLLKHHKVHWHIFYFIIPVFAYYLTNEFFWIYFYFAFLPAIFTWSRRLDKALVVTARVKRFFIMLLIITILSELMCIISGNCMMYPLFLPLALSVFGNNMIEKNILARFKRDATSKLENLQDLKIITITASFGKTSIKNFISQILSKKYKVYQTPRSVNTINGLIKDVNENINSDIEIYVSEAGAREKGDILEIAQFLNPQYIVIGQIGEQHLEYFKTIENIKATKFELLSSNRLKKAFVYKENQLTSSNNNIESYPNNLQNIISTLDGISFELEINGKLEKFETEILGKFNANNLSVAIQIALEFGLDLDTIKESVKNINPIAHRLQKIVTPTKLIIDDSFNGNFDGISEGIELAKQYDGRKVIITCGLVESTDEINRQLALKIDEVFDFIVITGELNKKVLTENINTKKVVHLNKKANMEKFIKEHTQNGDFILFANDAPSFI